jgi:hypothetical protein
MPSDQYTHRKIIRVVCEGKLENVISLPEYPGYAAWITPPETETETEETLKKVLTLPGVKAVERVLRVYDPV